MRKVFYIFRHGETDLNRQKRWQGSGTNSELNENGLKQAEDLSLKLSGKNIEVIFSSPLTRAMQTAQKVSQKTGADLVVKNDLRECFYGKAEAVESCVLEAKYPDVFKNWHNPNFWDIRFKGGESKSEVLHRVLNVLESLTLLSFDNFGVAIHGGTMGILLNHWGVNFDKIPNCAVFCLVWEDGKWQVSGDLF